MENSFSNLNYASLLSFFFIALLLNLFFISNFKIKSNKSQSIQDIHIGDTPRVGGFIIFILFFIFEVFFIKYIDYFTWLLFIVILTPAFLEDINIKINPHTRLLVMLLVSIFIVINIPLLPRFNFGNLNFIVNHQIFQVFFFSIAIVVVMNGQNMLDGVHGLSAVQGFCTFLCIIILGLHVNSFLYIQAGLIMLLLIISFLLFNYPLGKIFLGDCGSYFIGLLVSFFIIDVFAKNPKLPVWLAVVILFYPAFEVLFSYIRKVIKKKSPFYPDRKHLHSIIFYFFKDRKKNLSISNVFVLPVLSILWLSPIFFVFFSLRYTFFAFLAVFISAFIYLAYYFAFNKINNEGK